MLRGIFLVLVFLLVPCLTHAQSSEGDLDIFGYFQAVFDNSSEQTSITGLPDLSTNRSTFMLQQANIFFRKQFDPRFTSFVNLEFTQTYSSSRGWGTFRIEEAWVWYEPSKQFSVKAGLLVPVFNNLNEIKNRMPLLPYVIRPFVYESVAEGAASSDEFIPGSAYVQLQGTVPLADAKLEYALYAGNGDPSFTTSSDAYGRYLIGGADTTTYKLVGGRVGLKLGKLKTGFSFTYDRANRSQIGLGTVPRRRFGGDLSFQLGPLSLESELIKTQETLDDGQLMMYQMAGMMDPRLGSKPSNFFTYGLLVYDITDQFYGFGGIQYIDVHGNSSTRGVMVGGGFRPADQVVVKAQYLHIENDFGSLSSYRSDRVEVGVSVMF